MRDEGDEKMAADRRTFLKLLGAGVGAAGLAPVSRAAEMLPRKARRVVVVGGGYGGTVAAKYVRMMDPSIEVVLVERNQQYFSCPFSNYYIGGLIPDMSPLTIGYARLAANHGIKFVQAEVTGIDPAAKVVVTAGGTIAYDRLILSPGVEFRLHEIEGYDDKTDQVMPHAWAAGKQTILLRQQLEAMKDGGTVIVSMPLVPYRCPLGPYERVTLIAHYLKRHKPRSKVFMLDANTEVTTMKPLFVKAWEEQYKGILEYVPAKRVTAVETGSRTLLVEGLEDHTADVVNFIPPQRAGAIAGKAGLVEAEGNWCPVDATTFESTLQKDIHVIGDSCNAWAMPKSGYSANSQAKVCATNVVALMNGKETVDLSGINVCYGAINDHESVSIAGVYRVSHDHIVAVPDSGGISPVDFSQTRLEHIYAESWLKNILLEMST
ncbi:MAG: FAD/NAD(P)-binding oxidoreductase [Rhodocyclaceae bacterium]|nr:FAD/NAD(P)-binding oxidoreductase [Rhodocyclaceae bacterium]